MVGLTINSAVKTIAKREGLLSAEEHEGNARASVYEACKPPRKSFSDPFKSSPWRALQITFQEHSKREETYLHPHSKDETDSSPLLLSSGSQRTKQKFGTSAPLKAVS